MDSDRLMFALERLQPGDWSRFERFASAFLIDDYGAIRTVAAPNGDGGRDSEIFQADGDSSVLLQYSLTENWATKIRGTAKRIKQGFKDAKILVYVTNQQIGASADHLRKELREEHQLVLDIHDRSWFMERALASDGRIRVAAELAAAIVDPYLASKGLLESKALALPEIESKAAILHLQLQWQDDSRDRGLTKLCFDGLLKSVIRETTAKKRMTRQLIRDAIERLLPNHPSEFLQIQTDSALKRLENKAVKHLREPDEFFLSDDEVARVRDGLLQRELKDLQLNREIRQTVEEFFDVAPSNVITATLAIRVRRLLDQFLFNKGEEFASVISQNKPLRVTGDAVDVLVANDFASNPDNTRLGADAVAAVRSGLLETLQRSRPAVQAYLREIADGYTLFGFLRAVPDVQKALQRVFSGGEIWLDTSVLLPAMAETLLAPEEQIVSRVIRAARDAGMGLRVTSGVIEEVERHLNRCMAYVRASAGTWVGGVPFLYAMYALSGNSAGPFTAWAENFCGAERPLDDIADYLSDEFDVKREDLEKEVEATPERLRWEVDRIWREAHEARRSSGVAEFDAFIVDKLVKHDVECFLGVLGKRRGGGTSELGYAHWWLTFDKTARDFEQKLSAALGNGAPKVPVMSPDFLADYLAMGPTRSKITKNTESSLPVMMFGIVAEYVPEELLDIARGMRRDFGSANDRLLRRKLRDTLDLLRQKPGALAKGGFAAVRQRLETALRNRRR